MNKVLFANSDIAVRLCYYQRQSEMPDHYHDLHQVSFLLSGEILESSKQSTREVLAPGVGIKPAGFTHANQYGDNGTLILSLNISPNLKADAIATDLSDWRWTPHLSKKNVIDLKIVSRIMNAANAQEKEAIAWDMLAYAEPHSSTGRTSKPRWLDNVKEQLADDRSANVLEIARSHDVHPAYLSRAFKQFTGCSPVMYRTGLKLSQALDGLYHGKTITAAAHDAQFSDNAHFTRQAQRLLGMPPRQIQQLMLS